MRYYFDLQDAEGHHRDDTGLLCDDFESARCQAQSVLPEIARDQMPDGEHLRLACEVRDEAGRIVYRAELTFRGTRFGGGAGARTQPPPSAAVW